jgi:HD-GYP domain-containing protein (c-di-GMP phosphodiesterase class II)
LFNTIKSSNHSRIQIRKTLKRHKIDVNHLRIGMFVVDLDCPWSETPFLCQGFTIETHYDLEMLCKCCQFVYIDSAEEKQFEYAPYSANRKIKRTSITKNKNSASELNDANHTYQAAKKHIRLLLSDAQLGQALSTIETQVIIRKCANKVIENPNAILWLTRLKNSDDYTAEHSINVSLLAIALGRHMGMDERELENLGLCALLHDVGKVNVANEILNKSGPLNPTEFDEIAKHTIYAKKLLMERNDIYPGVIDVAYNHHERLDGKGYPRGIDGTEISMFTRVVTIVDAYDAMTSDRCYRKGISSLDALTIINKHKGTQFDANAAQIFIAMIGLYPAGYLMEMKNGEVGIIISHDKGYPLRPRVIMILDKNKQPQPETIINLSQYPCDLCGNKYEPKFVFRSGAFGINVRDFFGKGVKVKGMDYSMLSE